MGDERLNYYGVSYGTLIGAIYADRFSSRVGFMVLDSAVSPDVVDDPSVTQRDVGTVAIRLVGVSFASMERSWPRVVADTAILLAGTGFASSARVLASRLNR